MVFFTVLKFVSIYCRICITKSLIQLVTYATILDHIFLRGERVRAASDIFSLKLMMAQVVFRRTRRTPNEFLRQETHDDECFCLACRSTKYLEQFMRNSSTQLGFYHELLEFLRKKSCKRVFKNTLQQIVNGKAYREKCLGEQNLYKYWKPWAKRQNQFKYMPEEELEAMSRFLSACSSVYDKWSTIVDNLTNPEVSPDIDASTFSVEYFQRASDRNWGVFSIMLT